LQVSSFRVPISGVLIIKRHQDKFLKIYENREFNFIHISSFIFFKPIAQATAIAD